MANDFEDGLGKVIGNKIKDYAEENAKADSKVDSWLQKLVDSSWTAAMVGVGGALLIVALLIAIFF